MNARTQTFGHGGSTVHEHTLGELVDAVLGHVGASMTPPDHVPQGAYIPVGQRIAAVMAGFHRA